jgi:hypothetical protein
MSLEKTSTSSPHWGHFLIERVGVRRFAAPGQWSGMVSVLQKGLCAGMRNQRFYQPLVIDRGIVHEVRYGHHRHR